jgi:chromosome segregation ATPase
MGSDQTTRLSPFGIAAVALDQELQRLERLTEAAGRVGLDSRRDLERAARMADDAVASHQRLAEHMGTLAAALQEVGARNQRCVDALSTRKAELAARMQEVGAIVEGASALGAVANEISAAVQRLAGEAKTGEASDQLVPQLEVLGARLDGVIEEAARLGRLARDARVAELADEIESLRQQVLSARNKLTLLGKQLAPTTPPSGV